MSTIASGASPGLGARTARYPTIRIAGDARERGRSYGAHAGGRVAATIRGYERAFRHYAGWEWPRVREEALRFEAPIQAAFPAYLEEMRGLAEGAWVSLADVLAINVRTEIMFAGQARTAAALRVPPLECSALGALPDVTRTGHTILAQNWDWLAHCYDTVVVLEVEPEDGPRFVTVVEAGLLAKTGLNEHGLGVCTNALVTTRDAGEPAIPYHVLLRALMDVRTPSQAVATVLGLPRSSSANFLVGHRDGVVVDLEARPGGASTVRVVMPHDGLVLHTNHFLQDVGDEELSIWSMPSTTIRLDRLRRRLVTERGHLRRRTIAAALADHTNDPDGVCNHVDELDPEPERGGTIASVLMDLDRRRLWVAHGSPCAVPFVEHDLTGLWGDR